MASLRARVLAVPLLIAAAGAGCGDSRPVGIDDAGGLPDDAGPAHSDGGTPGCSCAPGFHRDRIIVLSQAAELWSYDPAANRFDEIGPIGCAPPGAATYSMAVDDQGFAWSLLVDTGELRLVDVNDPDTCVDPGFEPTGAFFLFGMSFANRSAADVCGDLYMHSYGGEGPFGKGEDIGTLGVMDPDTLEVRSVSRIDYDGGELAGTKDGRLFAFAGLEPPELVEYDKDTGEVLASTVLEGFSKTNASAFAFFGGDLWFFTEAPPATCDPCLEAICADVWADCQEDPVCAEAVACAVREAQVRDDCGGLAGEAMLGCLEACQDECLTNPRARVSQVTRYDLDDSDGMGPRLVPVDGRAPIRVVGAGASTCVPLR